jgi:hypothetical protein
VAELNTLIAMTAENGLDGLQAPLPMGWLEALGLFVGIPLLVIILVYLAVYGTSWARSSQPGSSEDQGLALTQPGATDRS